MSITLSKDMMYHIYSIKHPTSNKRPPWISAHPCPPSPSKKSSLLHKVIEIDYIYMYF